MNDTLLLGGYVGLSGAQVWNLCNFTAEKKLSLAALKIYLAASEMIERRCKVQKSPFYGVGELKKLTGLKDRAISDGLRELRKHEMLEFSEGAVKLLPQDPTDYEEQPFDTDANRIVPIPRRLIRALCAHTKKSEIVIALIHCARGLFLLGKKIVMRGAVRGSWISEVFGFGKTVIHSARAWLRSLGFLKEQEGVEQWRKNRWGYYFEIACGKLPKRKKRNTSKYALSGGLLKRIPFNKLKLTNTSTRVRTQRNKPVDTGFFKRKFSSSGPDIRDILTEDLKRISTLIPLFRQATSKGIIANSTLAFQNFVGASVRALNQGKNPPAFFITLIKNQDYWKHITHDEEARAIRAIKRYKEKQGRKLAAQKNEEAEAKKKKVTALISGLLPEIPHAYVEENY